MFAAIRAELERELAARRATYPRLVAKGAMDAREAEHQTALAQAWLEDCERFHTAEANGVHPLTLPRVSTLTWRQRRAGILRELAHRARIYPRWIAKGNLDRAEADRRNAALEAMLDLYEWGNDWLPEPPDAGEDQRRAQSYALMAERWHRRGDHEARDMALQAVALHDRELADALRSKFAAKQEELNLA